MMVITKKNVGDLFEKSLCIISWHHYSYSVFTADYRKHTAIVFDSFLFIAVSVCAI